MRFITNSIGEVVDTKLITVTRIINKKQQDVEIPLNRVCSPRVPEYPETLKGYTFPSMRVDDRDLLGEGEAQSKLWNDYCRELQGMQARWEKFTQCHGGIKLSDDKQEY